MGESSSSPQRTQRTQRSLCTGVTRSTTLILCLLGVLCGGVVLSAQEPPAPQAVSAAQLQTAIDKLGDLDYDMRTAAARTIRRTPAPQAVTALLRAVAEHTDGFVRYRALVLLTG